MSGDGKKRIGAKAVVGFSVLLGIALILMQARHVIFPSVSRDEVLHGTSFSFSFNDWNWETGLSTTFQCDGDGHVRFDFHAGTYPVERDGHVSHVPYRRNAQFTASAAEVMALRTALADNGYFELNDQYLNRDIQDGAQTSFVATVGEHRKAVRCSNEYPEGIVAIQRHVERRLVRAHAAEIARAPIELRAGFPPPPADLH